MSLTIDRFDTSIGTLRLVCDDEGTLHALEFADREAKIPHAEAAPGRAPAPVRRALEDYFAGDLDALDDILVAARGTPFQREVWAALRRIPAGATTSYGALAAEIGRPKAVRAVGLANGANPVAIVVPCHRVIGADGSLTGYGGGLDRKRWLLAHEGVAAFRLA
jgi:methylated-DNA-[protein]-cysteine S-methyltransferase